MGTFYAFAVLASLISAIASFGTLLFFKRRLRSLIILLSSLGVMLATSLLYAPYAPRPAAKAAAVSTNAVVSEPAQSAVPSPVAATATEKPVAASAEAPRLNGETQSFPDPILGALKPSTVMCDTEDELIASLAGGMQSQAGAGTSDTRATGCRRVSGRHVVKVLQLAGSSVEIRVPNGPEGDRVGFVRHDDLSSADARQKPRPKFVVSADATAVCRRTTDFSAALEAARELDVDWFRTNSACKIVHKGDQVFMMLNDAPYDKVCVGSEKDCFLGWLPFTSVEEAKGPPVVIASGRLRICWPSDIPQNERPSDLTIPFGVVFLDSGEQGKENNGDRGQNGTIVTTKKVLLPKARDCVIAPGSLLDDPNASWDRPAIRKATVAARRFYLPDTVLVSPKSNERKPLPDTFSMDPLAYIESDFK